MISRLSSPSVCVIDDEAQDYQPILDALLNLGIGCVHVRGDVSAPLPPQPFNGLRIVFTDLHLSSGAVGKTAAAHTANVFKKVVSAKTAPVLVVIWSKYTDERNGNPDVPLDDQPTEAELFKAALFEAEPAFQNKLLFTEMAKPKPANRPADSNEWVKSLTDDIEAQIKKFPGCDLLWSWESIIHTAGISISEGLTELALGSTSNPSSAAVLDENLKLVFRQLAKAQGGPDCSESSAHRHLSAVLAQTLADELEQSDGIEDLSIHGSWLGDSNGLPNPAPFASKFNALMLTSAVSNGPRPFVPGTVYSTNNPSMFETSFGLSANELFDALFQKATKGLTLEEFKSQAVHVAVEISPACDFHQGHRRQALLVAGLLVPIAGRANAKQADALLTLPNFKFRWPEEGKTEEDVFLIFCCRFKLTITHAVQPQWLAPWFRLRELPTASLRNWHAGHAARVGYVSL